MRANKIGYWRILPERKCNQKKSSTLCLAEMMNLLPKRAAEFNEIKQISENSTVKFEHGWEMERLLKIYDLSDKQREIKQAVKVYKPCYNHHEIMGNKKPISESSIDRGSSWLKLRRKREVGIGPIQSTDVRGCSESSLSATHDSTKSQNRGEVSVWGKPAGEWLWRYGGCFHSSAAARKCFAKVKRESAALSSCWSWKYKARGPQHPRQA